MSNVLAITVLLLASLAFVWFLVWTARGEARRHRYEEDVSHVKPLREGGDGNV